MDILKGLTKDRSLDAGLEVSLHDSKESQSGSHDATFLSAVPATWGDLLIRG
jgi:hypothetical protein